MPLLEIVYALRGLWRLVHLDPHGVDYFDRSIAGFWRSFRVAFLVLPAYVLLIPARMTLDPPSGSWERIFAVEILTYLIGWLAFPVAAYEICRRIGRDAEYPGLVVVYNWASIPSVLLLIIVAGCLISPSLLWLGILLSYATQAALFGFVWFISRTTLGVDGMTALIFAVLDFALSKILGGLTHFME
jgi:hypothetical protein